MNREIKFRAWDADAGQMRDDRFVTLQYDKIKENQRFVLIQFTGLKDKNGKEIYEGDVVRITDSHAPTYNAEIKWVGNGWWLTDGRGGNFLPNEESREIIGNIYENPELLTP